jgi:hypothetical protein
MRAGSDRILDAQYGLWRDSLAMWLGKEVVSLPPLPQELGIQ